MADNVLARLLDPVVRWARAKSRVGIAVVGALPGRDAEAWAQPRALPLGIPTDAIAPRQADLLVVVGRISHKLAPFLVRTHAAMAQPASVIVIEMESPRLESPSLPRLETPSLPATESPSLPRMESPSLPRMESPSMPRMYATVADVAAIIPVDVVIRGKAPSPPTIARALAALNERTRASDASAQARATDATVSNT